MSRDIWHIPTVCEAMYQHVTEEVIVGCGGDKFG